MKKPLIVDNVTTAYDKADVLHKVSLTIQPGTITCLLGSNGSGKSTLIRSILGLTPARLGEIHFNGRRLSDLPTHRIISHGIACIPEGRKVFPAMSVEENLQVGAYQETSSIMVQRRMQEVYELFPRLLERRQQLAGTLSGGEQAMVSIGRGLMGEPKLLIIDEPSLGLSPALVIQNFEIIRTIKDRGITVFLVEQNVHQTLAVADYGYVLSQGKVVAEGTAAHLRDDPEVNRAYFG